MACHTQWRINDSGRHGLDYAGVSVVIAMHHTRRRDVKEIFRAIQAMESEVLDVWAEQSEKNKG